MVSGDFETRCAAGGWRLRRPRSDPAAGACPQNGRPTFHWPVRPGVRRPADSARSKPRRGRKTRAWCGKRTGSGNLRGGVPRPCRRCAAGVSESRHRPREQSLFPGEPEDRHRRLQTSRRKPLKRFPDSQVLESNWESNGHLNLSQGKWGTGCLAVKSRESIEILSHVEKYRSFYVGETVLSLSRELRFPGSCL